MRAARARRLTSGDYVAMRVPLTSLGLAIFYLVSSAGSPATPEHFCEGACAPLVIVSVDGRITQVGASATTVGELLDDLDIELSPLDRTRPSPNTPIVHEMTVEVTRVTCTEEVVEEPAAPPVLVLADPDRPATFTKTLDSGRSGVVRRTMRVWAKDGEETQRSVVQEEYLKAPSRAVVLRGTRGLSKRDRSWRYPMTMVATAYEPGPRSCGKWADGYTAIGLKARRGIVAVDERVIPMRTRLYIPEYGFALAADRGGAIKGRRIDLFYPTYREAMEFGRRRVKVYVLD